VPGCAETSGIIPERDFGNKKTGTKHDEAQGAFHRLYACRDLRQKATIKPIRANHGFLSGAHSFFSIVI
jgi:hypothetical protein